MKASGMDITTMPLNKRMAQAGICARRKAVQLIQGGLVRVNGSIIVEPFFRVKQTDVVLYKERVLKSAPRNHLYIMLNKPRNVITTCVDEKDRITVLDLLPPAFRHLYPVGRLDKDSTGLLLLTNNGEFAQKLAHPRHAVQKTYQVTLDRPLPPAMRESIERGIYLEDGKVSVDTIAYTNRRDYSKLSITLHSGKNKIIRRIFKQCGFWVKSLDRPVYAGLSTKGLAQGMWRTLSKYELENIQKLIKKSTYSEPIKRDIRDSKQS